MAAGSSERPPTKWVHIDFLDHMNGRDGGNLSRSIYSGSVDDKSVCVYEVGSLTKISWTERDGADLCQHVFPTERLLTIRSNTVINMETSDGALGDSSG